ncbi:MAG TPA: cbb3-type cytochrome c oxidase subunit I [Polyangiaceae bacterium]
MHVALPSERNSFDSYTAPKRATQGRWQASVDRLHVISFGVLLVVGMTLAALGLVFVRMRWLLSLHGSVLVFLCFLPGLSLSVGPTWAPALVTAKQVWARALSLICFWCGAIAVVVGSLLQNQPIGYRYYLGYARSSWSALFVTSLGISALALALAISGALFSELHRYAKRCGRSTPLLCGLAVAGTVHLVVAPFAAAVPVALLLERVTRWVAFDPERGGDPAVLAHLFWLYVHPIGIVAMLPAIGLVSSLLNGSSAQAPRPARHMELVFSVIAGLSLFTWGVHLGDIMSPSLRVGFAFAAILGGGIAGFALPWPVARAGHGNGLTKATAVMLALAALGFLPICLPNLGGRMQGSGFDETHLHAMAFGSLLLPMFATPRAIAQLAGARDCAGQVRWSHLGLMDLQHLANGFGCIKQN